MKAALIFFSGTGNTKRTLEFAKTNLPFECDTFDVIKDDVVNMANYDYLMIFYPIYGFNAPKPIIDYVKRIKKIEQNRPCLVMKNSGEHLFWNNGSSLHLRNILKRRNITLVSEYHYLMPYSFIFKHSDYMAYQMITTAEQLIKLDMDDFLNGNYVKIKRFFLDSAFAFFLRIQWWGGRFNGRFYKIDNSKCIKCMKCVNDCPVHNITFKDNKFKFGKECLMCQRCVMYCPKDAFKSLGFFTSWEVNKPYSFKEQKVFQKEVRPRYCKKNYQKYFEQSKIRIANSK